METDIPQIRFMSLIYWYYKTPLNFEPTFDCWFDAPIEQKGKGNRIEHNLALEWVKELRSKYPDVVHIVSTPIPEQFFIS
jgi:hypothetical protein